MTNGERSVNPLRDEASLKRSGNQKKKTHFVGLFFLTGLRPVLTGLRPVLPLGQCSPSKILKSSNKNFKVQSVNVIKFCKRKSLKFLV